jgi:hypothetical protein
MIRGLIFALVRIVIFAFAFYFVYKVVREFFIGLTGHDPRKSGKKPPEQQPPPQKSVQHYADVADAKFKDIPPEVKS